MTDSTRRAWLTSLQTGKTYDIAPLFSCPETGGELSVTIDLADAAEEFAANWKKPGSIWDRFGAVLVPGDKSKVLSLGEGSTPLIRSERLSSELGLKNLYFKFEGSNPTGSFKDRQMSVALSVGRSWGRTRYATVSSGNVGNALSAYCAKAGFDSYVWVADDTAAGKRDQISVYGAQLFLVPAPTDGNVRRYWHLFKDLQKFCIDRDIVPMISARPVNPFMVEGTKTISFEITASLGEVPDEMFCCVGGGGLLGGMFKGFTELKGLGQTTRMPRMHGAQRVDRHYAPIDRLHETEFVEGDYYLPLDGDWATQAIRETQGTLTLLEEPAIAEAQTLLARKEGIFAEPQGAYAVAALIRAARNKEIAPDAVVVCTITGMGLKDMGATKRFGDFIETHAPIAVGGLEDSGL